MSIQEICKNYRIENYTINPDGSIDVIGDVNVQSSNLKELPLTFNIVTGHFYCNENKLTSLRGCPKEIGGDFDCSWNHLTTLKHSPKKVSGVFFCDNNYLTNLKFVSDCDKIFCANNDIPLYEFRYIFMHKIREISIHGNYNEILNELLQEDIPITEKIQRLRDMAMYLELHKYY